MADKQPSMGIRERASLAWQLLTHDAKRAAQSGSRSGTQAPYQWPETRLDRPQWAAVDYQSFVREGFNRNSVLYSAIMYKVRSGIIAPLRAYEGTIEHPVPADPEHPLSMLAKRPNMYMSGVQLQMLLDIYLNIAGEAYIYLARSSSNVTPEAMYPMRPDRVFPVPKPNAKDELLGFIYVPEGVSVNDTERVRPMLPQDVIHIKWPAADDPLEGLGSGSSPMRSNGQSLDVDNAITGFLKLFFQKGTMIHTYLKFDVPMDDDQVARARKRFSEIYGGYQNWTGPAILDQAGEIKTFTMSFKDMGFDALDERNETRIAGPFGVPLILIGARIGLLRSTYANYKEARAAYWEDTRIPELMLFEESYQYYLQSDDGVFLAFDTSKVPALRRDVPGLVSAFIQLVGSGVPKHTAAETVGLNIGTLPDGDIVYNPLNWVAAGVDSDGDDGDMSESVDATQDTRKEKSADGLWKRMQKELGLRTPKRSKRSISSVGGGASTGSGGTVTVRLPEAPEIDLQPMMKSFEEGIERLVKESQSQAPTVYNNPAPDMAPLGQALELMAHLIADALTRTRDVTVLNNIEPVAVTLNATLTQPAEVETIKLKRTATGELVGEKRSVPQ